MKSLARPSDTQELVGRLGTIRPASERRWGSMSAHQMICHLADGYRLYLGEIVAAPVRGFAPKWLVRWFALHAPVRWPHGIPTMPELDQQAGRGTPPAEFASDMRELEELLHRVAGLPRDFRFPPHPYMGRLAHGQWMRLAYLHADHHLRQFGA